MRIFNIEFGLNRDRHNKLIFCKPGVYDTVCGCTIFDIGYFYLTILRGECK